LIACEKGPTGLGARSVEIARNPVSDAVAFGSALTAAIGATAAANPPVAALRKNDLRFILLSLPTPISISNSQDSSRAHLRALGNIFCCELSERAG
jgi:hypothetical protein